jgi:hypothetical protein
MQIDQLACDEPQESGPPMRHPHQEIADLLALAVLRMCLPKAQGREDLRDALGPTDFPQFEDEGAYPEGEELESGNSDSSAVSLGWTGQQSVNANPPQNKGVRA